VLFDFLISSLEERSLSFISFLLFIFMSLFDLVSDDLDLTLGLLFGGLVRPLEVRVFVLFFRNFGVGNTGFHRSESSWGSFTTSLN
jgi:hypothetical protein